MDSVFVRENMCVRERFIYFKVFVYVIMEAGKSKIYKVGQ